MSYNQRKRANNAVSKSTDIFQNYIKACTSAFGFYPMYSYSTHQFTEKAG